MDRPLAYCTTAGCSARVPFGRCAAHLVRRVERDRPDVDVRRWFRTERWRRLRADVLVAAGYACADCGRVAARLDVDHIRKHGGNPILFWDRTNLQALCSGCHARKTNRGA